MDNLTHSLVGALLRRAGLGEGATRPMLVCVLAANAPDLDVAMGLAPETYLVWHRGVTHAVIAIPVMALAAVALAWGVDRLIAAIRRRPASRWRWKAAWLTALIPAASHPLLDAMNSYAVRPWLPFSNEWRSFNTLFVIDWVVLLALLTAVCWPLLANLVAREIGAPKGSGRRAAWAALAAVALYIGWQGRAQARVVAAVEARLWDGQPAKDVAAFPSPFDPRGWMAYVETESYRMTLPVRIDRLEEIERTQGRKFYPPAERSAVDAAWATPIGQAYRQFARYPLELVEPLPDGVRVTLTDARFTRLDRTGFQCVVELDGSGRVVRESFEF